MKIGEPTLDELWREATADLAKGGVEVALKWAFKHAKAVARATRAEMAAKAHEADRLRMQIEVPQLQDPAALNLMVAPMRESIEGLAMVTASLHADAIDVAEARACLTAIEHVWQLAAKTPKQAAAAPSRQPASRPKAA